MMRKIFAVATIILIDFFASIALAQSDNEQNSPKNSGEASAQYKQHDNGKMQSPINIPAEFVPIKNQLFFDYYIYEIDRKGHSIQLNYTPNSEIILDDTHYKLAQIHFHTQAEHTIQGKTYPMEIHLVHKDNKGEIAVISVLIKEGESNEFLGSVIKNTPRSSDKLIPEFGIISIIPKNKTYYRYDGSLTTPPYTEGVKWIVFATPVEASKAEINFFTSILGKNHRSLQALEGRKIGKFQEKIQVKN